MRFMWTALVAVGLFGGCRTHTLDDGPYRFSTVEVLRDDCSLAGTFTLLDRGTLTTTGNLVRMGFLSEKADVNGGYRVKEEALVLDGVLANTHLTIRGSDCLVDSLQLHLETETVDPRSFQGVMSVTTVSRSFPQCNCTYWYRFTASHE